MTYLSPLRATFIPLCRLPVARSSARSIMSEPQTLAVAAAIPEVQPQPIASSSSLPPPTAPGSTNPASSTSNPPMTKSAMKKAARRARIEAEKPIRRAKEKAARKAKMASLKEDLKAGRLSDAELAAWEAKKEAQALKSKFKQGGGKKTDHVGTRVDLNSPDAWQGGIVIDVGFDDLMSEQEIKSMSSQLGYLYNTNRLSTKPFRKVVMSGFAEGTRLRERMDKGLGGANRRWIGMEWKDEDVGELAKAPGEVAMEPTAEVDQREAGPSTIPTPTNPFPGQEYIYLSADAPTEITELKENETYVIGGIVDRNRYKNLCQNKAEKLGMKTASLPIGSYLANMPTRKVLTVNQVFDILIRFNELKDWTKALEAVIPLRKFHEGREAKTEANRKAKAAAGESDDDEGQDAEMAGDDEAVDEEAMMNQMMTEEEAMMNA